MVDLGDVQTGKASQDIGEVFLGIDAAAPATDDERVDHGTAPTGIRMPQEEPAAAADSGDAHGVFHQIMVDLVSARFQIAKERLVFIDEVADRLAQTQTS